MVRRGRADYCHRNDRHHPGPHRTIRLHVRRRERVGFLASGPAAGGAARPAQHRHHRIPDLFMMLVE